jgi:peptide/nickel transport system permease protein
MPQDMLLWGGVIWLVVLVLAALLSPLLPIQSGDVIGFGPRLAPPEARWPLGTDELGRSLLPRVLGAVRVTILLAVVAVAITSIVGTVLGVVAAFSRGLLDLVIVRLADVLFSFPALILAVLIAALVGSGQVPAIAASVLVTLPLFIRAIRSVAIGVANQDFVESSMVSGASYKRVVFVHIIPNVLTTAAIQLTYALSVGMVIESGLSFLGLGVQPPAASLGSLLRAGTAYIGSAPWLVLPASIVLSSAILSINLIGDGLRDRLAPLQGRSLL